MSVIVQLCVVIVTIAVVAVAIVAIRMMLQFRATAKKHEASYSHLVEILEESRETSKKVRELVVTLDQIALTVRNGASRVEGLVDRAADVGSLVLNELEQPVYQAVTLMRAVRAGASALARRWTHGRQPVFESTEGGNHVRESR